MARIEKSIEVDVPLHTAYNQWTQFETFPQFMEGVREVRQIDDTHLYWHAEIAGKDKEWQSQITEQIPDQCIAWRSVSGGENAGRVTFTPLDANRTRILLSIDYDPEGLRESVGDVLGFTTRRVEGDLERFKNFIEGRSRETGAWRGEVRGGHQTFSGSAAETGSTQSFGPGQGAGMQRPGTSATQTIGAEHGAGMQQAGATQDVGIGHGSARPPMSQAWSRGMAPGLFSGAGGVWEEPFSMIRRMSEEMDRMFETFMGRSAFTALREQQGGMAHFWTPQVDVSRRGEDLLVCADLPGLRKQDVHVDIDDGVLVIEGERSSESQADAYRMERSYGRFYRAMALPDGADVERAHATMHDGVLEICIPMPRRTRGHRLEVKDASETPAPASKTQGFGSR